MGVVEPLDECWWQPETAGAPPDDAPFDAPLLAPYSETQPGYETLFGPSQEFAVDEKNQYTVCLWRLWAKDDPAVGDADKRRINAMQSALGPLDDDVRYIRMQIADLRRCFYSFPGTVDAVLRGIGSGKAQLDADLSCEPPWRDLRPILRRRQGLPSEEPNARQGLAYAYFVILTGWVAGADPRWVRYQVPNGNVELVDEVYKRLGPPSAAKAMQVQRVSTSLLLWGYPSHEPWGARWQRLSALLQAQGSLAKATGEDDALGRLIDSNNDKGTCHHSFFRHLDHQIAAIGAGSPVDLPGKGGERKRILEAVTNYAHSLVSWLARRSVREAVSLWEPGGDVIDRVYSALGEPSPVKRWLVACLWKHLIEDQAHLGRGALDSEPERFELPSECLNP